MRGGSFQGKNLLLVLNSVGSAAEACGQQLAANLLRIRRRFDDTKTMRTDGTSAATGSSVVMTRDAMGVIVSVGEGMTGVLGWDPEQLEGRPSTEFVHPEDQPGAIVSWFQMVNAPGETRRWEGRYATPEDTWRWVECINVSHLDDPDNPVVVTTMRLATSTRVNLREELRARNQLLSRLSDAMPVGMFQVSSDRRITFTNDRLHVILGCPASGSMDEQFASVEDNDRVLLARSLDAVLEEDQPLDDLELTFVRSSDGASATRRVCVLSMRPLTDDIGSVTGAVGCVSDVTEQVLLRRQLELRANVDELTSCLSRTAILQVLASTLDHQRETGGGLAVVFVDLCGFKEVNDLFGHASGDKVLQIAGARLKNVVREGDHVGRFGGDEFLIVCPRITTEKVALEVAERIRRSLSCNVDLTTGTVNLRASVGVALSSDSSDPDALIAHADYAMYEAKRVGSSSVEVFALR